MTFTEVALGGNGKTIVSLSEKNPEPGDYVIVVFARKHSVMHQFCITRAETDGEGDCQVQFSAQVIRYN